jgi:zinc and cadmium transporter
MYLNILLLFFSSLLSGMIIFFLPHLNIKKFKILLTFSGAYLFSITVIHILPEIFHGSDTISLTGIYVLAGFFIQMVLEYFTSGVEHGHIHIHDEEVSHVPYSMLISLGLHSFLEGSLLVHPSHTHNHGASSTLLFGLILHKIPESFALMSVLVFRLGKKYPAMLLLIIFSCASPAGLYMSNMLYFFNGVSKNIFVFLFAVVAGNFLYISTTIFFETSPDHQFKANKLMVALLGAFLAIMAEFFLNS